MSDGGRSTRPQPGPGWYPDPMTPSRRRYWNGTSWTYATEDAVPFEHPAPFDAQPLPEGSRLPDPVARRPPEPPEPEKKPASPAQRRLKWGGAVVVGLIVGLIGVALLNRGSSDDPPAVDEDPAVQAVPTTGGLGATDNNDPAQTSLGALIARPSDVAAPVSVVILPGGIGLAQPTLDLCDARYPSESRRKARVQDAVVDALGNVVLSTEAVLYDNAGATAQAFTELRSAVAACATDRYSPPPDTSWPQTPSVNRQAYDFTSDDGSGPRRLIAVYLQRGRALLGVYFLEPDVPQPSIEGQTSVEGIVGVFAGRLAALPVSVVGS